MGADYTSQAGNKKKTLLYVLDILREHSDENHGLSQKRIAELLALQYGIEMERKAIANNIEYLEDLNYPVEKNKDGVYLAGYPFNNTELRLLIDSVLSSRHISEVQAKGLIKKLCGLSSKYFRERVKHIHTIDEWTKSDNTGLFANIEMILTAITKKKKIRFTMNSYGIDKRLHPGREHIVSPLRLLMKEQRYFMLCVERIEDTFPEYRNEQVELVVRMLAVDMLTNITSTNMEAEKHKVAEETYEQLFREHPEMESFFFDEAEYITFVCPEDIIGKVIATFGKNARVSKIPTLDDEGMKRDFVWLQGKLKERFIKVTVKTTSYAVRQFVRKNAPYTMVLAPEKLKKSILREQYRQHEFSMMIEDKIKEAEERNKKK